MPATTPDVDAASEPNDVDLVLRHVTHRFPDELARALLPNARTLTDCSWRDTQVTSRERRMDKNLFVVADRVPRIEHVEWQLRWSPLLLRRMYEYHSLTTLGLIDAAKPGELIPRVRSTVVLLSGRRATPWPAFKRYRTVPDDEPFSGLRVHVDAVYQRTVAELAARASPLWMIFAPLAVDASRDNLPIVLRNLKKRTPRARFDELAVAMTVLADADGRERGLRETITAQLPEELVMQSWVYTQGRQKGIEEGIEQGIERGVERGVEQGLLALRQAITLALEVRGLSVTLDRRPQLDAETRIEVLQTWLTRAITAERADDVFTDPR